MTKQQFAAAPPYATTSAYPKSTPAFPKHAISQSQIRMDPSAIFSPVPVPNTRRVRL
jgi:hypothetical protein